ncbi:MAG: hypothetical protein GXZ11_07225 [Tissierellia bacterium]|nr:hypothetical protein [Tissierellia bacterium]
MAYKLNGQSATPYINGSKATVKLNDNTVYQPVSKRWVYIGDTGSYNDTYSLGELPGFFCYLGGSSEIVDRLESAYPANNYRLGWRIRVHHSVTGRVGGPLDCGYQIYEVQEE